MNHSTKAFGENTRTVAQINEKIKHGDVQVLTAEEMKKLVESSSVEVAYKEVDVVTTGTFGAMCSSGAVINLGHSDPPIKIQKALINDVEICHPGAAVDLYIPATAMSVTKPFAYGGGHVIEDLVKGKEVELTATAYGTDCYPRTKLRTTISKMDLNQFYLVNFRNCYQRYDCATNSEDKTIYTYMGKLLPRFRNATYSGAGALNPLMNDPDYETIGIGTRIFVGGTQGYVIGEGTQHDPKNCLGTIMVRGNCMLMTPDYLRGASFNRYGTTLYIGIGIPIPILNKRLASKTAIRDEQILTDIVDYGIQRRDRPKLGKVSYKELKSGFINIRDRRVKVSSLSSLKTARKIAETLKKWISNGSFYLSAPAETLPRDSVCRSMRQTEKSGFVRDVMHKAVTCRKDEEIRAVAKLILDCSTNHIIAVDQQNRISGMITSWDITRAVAQDRGKLEEIMIRKVVTSSPDESLELASQKMARHNISALPVINSAKRVVGILTSEDISQLHGR